MVDIYLIFFFSSRRRHTRLQGDWSSDVCSSDLERAEKREHGGIERPLVEAVLDPEADDEAGERDARERYRRRGEGGREQAVPGDGGELDELVDEKREGRRSEEVG